MRRIILLLFVLAAAAGAVALLASPTDDVLAVEDTIVLARARLADVRNKITERSVEEEKCRREEEKVRERTGELSLEKSRLVKEYEFYNVPLFVAEAERDLSRELSAMGEDVSDIRIELTLVESTVPILEEERLTAEGQALVLVMRKLAEHRRRVETLRALLAQARRDVARARRVMGE